MMLAAGPGSIRVARASRFRDTTPQRLAPYSEAPGKTNGHQNGGVFDYFPEKLTSERNIS